MIGAAAFAGTAIKAVFDFRHVLLPLGRSEALPGSTAKKQGHAGGIVDGDARRTGQTIAAAAAEVTGEFLSQLIDSSLNFFGQGGGIGFKAEDILQLPLMLDAPQGEDVLEPIQPGKGQCGIGDKTAGQSLHGQKPQTQLFAGLLHGHVAFGGQRREGVLDGFVEPAFGCGNGDISAVVGQADMANHALTLEVLHLPVKGRILQRQHGGIVELVNIHIIGFEHGQAGFHIAFHALGGSGGCLGGDDNLIPNAFKGDAQLVFAVAVAAGGVVEGDSGFMGCTDQLYRIINSTPLQRQTAKGSAGDGETGFSKGCCTHSAPLFPAKADFMENLSCIQ